MKLISRVLGTTLHKNGVAFHVWAPHATQASVIGTFNGGDGSAHPTWPEDLGYWSVQVEGAKVSDQYKYQLVTPAGVTKRIDPYAREVSTSVGIAMIHDPTFDWADDDFSMAAWNQLIIYELHVGTFNDDDPFRPGKFITITARLEHLKRLGVNAIQIMPVRLFAGTRSWGHNPSHLFAIDSDYGETPGMKRFIKRAHQTGIAVILDVVYNHFGPNDLDLWQFNGWAENGKSGIYFYHDNRTITHWGETRPVYGRGKVRQFVLDNLVMWFDEYHVDGLRFESTLYVRKYGESGSKEPPDGWSILQAINETVSRSRPGRIKIAEDLPALRLRPREGDLRIQRSRLTIRPHSSLR